jgi:hypothetical protein
LTLPAAPTFSKRFYDKFGHDSVTELTRWLNGMDLTYRTQLSELNEVNFVRFDAKLEQRIGEVKTELRQEIALAKAELGREIIGIKSDIGEVRAEMRAGFAELENRLTSRLIRWMFVLWTGTTVTLLGAMFAITRL